MRLIEPKPRRPEPAAKPSLRGDRTPGRSRADVATGLRTCGKTCERHHRGPVCALSRSNGNRPPELCGDATLLDMPGAGRVLDVQPGHGTVVPVLMRVFEGERVIAAGTVKVRLNSSSTLLSAAGRAPRTSSPRTVLSRIAGSLRAPGI